MSTLLNTSFYDKDLHDLAPDLLGKLFVRTLDDGSRLSGHILEVEAYAQKDDPASHSYCGLTERNKVMFGAPGNLYIYFIYGMHYCCNVVSGPIGQGDAILIRSIEPYEGMDVMYSNRYGGKRLDKRSINNLCNGPGKLTQALNITKLHNGLDLCNSNVQIHHSNIIGDFSIATSRRIGIQKGKNLNWRYFIKDHKGVSKNL